MLITLSVKKIFNQTFYDFQLWELSMTTKTTKYSIMAAISVIAMLAIVSVSMSEAEVTRDIAVSTGSKYDEHKEAGLPYVEKTIVTNDLRMKDSNSIVMELVLRNAPEGAYLVLEPFATDSGFVTDPTLTREEVFERSQAASEGKVVSGIVTQKSMMSFDKETITLTNDKPEQLTVNIGLSESLRQKNPHSMTFNVGFNLVEKSGIDTIPMKTGGIELEGPNYEQ